MKILIVEDEELMVEALTTILTNQNYVVEIARDGESGWELIKDFGYDLLLLDVMLPKLDGISLCRQIRNQGLQLPILLLTGRDNSHEKAVGLDAGADDYLVKPFDEEELLARVRALLRRGSITSQPILEWGKLRLDPTSCEVSYDQQLLSLTPKEYALLELFLRNSRRVFSCSMILEHLWSYDDTPGEEAVRTHIKGLRQKLKAGGVSSSIIETVYGIGYRLKTQEESFDKNQNDPEELTANYRDAKSQSQKTFLAINEIWQKFQGRVVEQVDILEQAAQALIEKSLNKKLHSQAQIEAHTLAGSLGTFGIPEGTKIARKIENLLNLDQDIDEIDGAKLSILVQALQREIQLSYPANEVTAVNLDEYSLLLVVDKDPRFIEQITQESANWNLKITVATSIRTARNKLYQEHPSVVLLDPSISSELEDSFQLVREFSDRKPPVPVLILSEQISLSEAYATTVVRAAFARIPGTTFVQKPIAPSQILPKVKQVLQQSHVGETKVLAVDDDPKILALLQSLLTPWGLTVKTLAEPHKFWETLETVQPDLLILDVEMPGVSGIEICQVVRNDSHWSELPILFLTVHNDPDIVNQVFSVGADDFVSKPFIGPELVTRIINRLERIKLVRRMAKTEQNSKWQAIFDVQPEGVKLIDANGILLEINPAGLGIIEAANAEAVIGKSVYSIIHPQYHQAYEQLNQSVCQGNKGYLEFEIITCQGNRRWLETHAVPLQNREDGTVMQLAISHDITTRKKTETDLRQSKDELELRVAERTKELIEVNKRLQLELNERQRTQEELKNSQARLAGVVEIADDAIISIDANQRIILFNQGAEKIFGFEASEVLGRPLNILLPSRFEQIHRHYITDFSKFPAQARKMGERREIYGKHKDGREFPAEASISKLKLGKDTIYTVYLQDISERKQIERMKDEFVSVVSHELRTPLTSIHGSLGMLSSGLIKAESEQGKRLLQIAADSTERLVRLINDILDIERIESGKVKMEKQTCDVSDAIKQAVNIMQPLADKAGVSLSVTIASANSIWADCDRIVQTLTNLLSNAIKFSKAGDTVTLEVQLQGEEVLFAIKDTGRGIQKDKLETIFERFQQVDASDSRKQDGTGLGLAICKSIVQEHNGRIWVESILNEGSVFYFTVPLCKSVVVPQLESSELETSGITKAPSVLVCDDDPTIRSQLKTLLEQKGYRVITVAKGEDAITAATTQHPEIILLDLVMPGMNGWEVMAILKERPDTCDIPIIICSICTPGDTNQSSSEFVDWVCKPVEEHSLFPILRQVLNQSSKPSRVLVVEDDPELAELLTTLLKTNGIETFLAKTGREAIQLSQQVNPDLLILDIILPEGDGFGVVEWLRQHNQLSKIPLLVYSARDLDQLERTRLKLGHTEFLTKGRVTTQEFEQKVMELLQRITQSSNSGGDNGNQASISS